jgi:hypothetical protein
MSIFNRIKGIVTCGIEDTANNLVYVLAPPSQASYDTGIELAEVESLNCAGERVTSVRYTSTVKPKFNLNFGTQSMDLLGLKFGRRFSQVTRTVRLSRYLQVPADGIVPAATSGQIGFGVAANVATRASYLDDNQKSIAITQAPDFTTFDAAVTPLQFAIGANNAQKYGQTLWNRFVHYDMPIALSNVYGLSTSSISTVAIRLGMIDLQGEFAIWEFTGSPDTTGSIPIGEGQQDLSFFLADAPNITYTNQLLPC